MHFDGADGGHVLMLLQVEALSCHKGKMLTVVMFVAGLFDKPSRWH